MLRAIFRSIKHSPARLHCALGLLFVSLFALELFTLHMLDTTEYRLNDKFMRHHAAQFKAD